MKILFQFPEPYPGECLYSVLARYHDRSGNRTESASFFQLFGKRISIRNTVYSPSALKYASHWFEESDVLNMDILRNRHTLLNYGLLLSGCSVFGEGPETKKHYTFNRTLISSEKKLRYCPACMREQKILYGEPYWQLLPQIEGVDVCPIHGEIYRNSTVTVPETAYHFRSAASVLSDNGNASDAPKNVSQIEARYEICRKVSLETYWILENWALCESRSHRRSIECLVALLQSADLKLLDHEMEQTGVSSIFPRKSNVDAYRIYITYLSTAFEYIYIIHSLCGSMENYQKKIKNISFE